MNNLVSIVITTYNNKLKVDEAILSSVHQSHKNLNIIVVDDGSIDGTPEHLTSLAEEHSGLKLILKEHGERGLAREAGIKLSMELGSDYLFFMDDDMILDYQLVELCLKYFTSYENLGALVIPERPYSTYTNFYSKVKVFERSIINNAGRTLGKNSIEAARFWKMNAYNQSGGLNPTEISFEETQPTIRYRDNGGYILRAVDTFLRHDEKEATFKGIISKKYYYFNLMNKTFESEDKGFLKALSRWYFFRPVLYRAGNILRALRHPILAMGMFFMYVCLSFTGVVALLRKPRL
ncbi:MAG: glycosyltransferase [Spirochaetaceae bacterium]